MHQCLDAEEAPYGSCWGAGEDFPCLGRVTLYSLEKQELKAEEGGQEGEVWGERMRGYVAAFLNTIMLERRGEWEGNGTEGEAAAVNARMQEGHKVTGQDTKRTLTPPWC